jgi:DNA uptake protein ComE-like DNA-binding protein
LLDALIADVASGRRALDANLGPELWVANPGFKIAAAVWDAKRTEPLTINLNTASVAELMTVPGVDLSMARRIIAVRDARGFFRSIDELTEAGVPGGVIESLREMRKAMDQVGRYERQ